jgi:pimeloyl-ACP methyl ester carboxylesterase
LLVAHQLFVRESDAAKLAGQDVPAGGKCEIRFPVSKYYQDYAAEGGNPRPSTGRAVLMFPNGFNPSRTWPVLIVTSTSDLDRTSPMDAPLYQETATKEGWIVLATDATIRPRADSTAWRFAILAAALQTIRHDWPQSAQWPVALAGFSGGAKTTGELGAMLAKSGPIRICGFLLIGINSDRLSAAYKDFRPAPGFLSTPTWISSGASDQVAPPASEELVYYSLKRTGFQQVRFEHFFGGHAVKSAEVRRALHWFRELGKF